MIILCWVWRWRDVVCFEQQANIPSDKVDSLFYEVWLFEDTLKDLVLRMCGKPEHPGEKGGSCGMGTSPNGVGSFE